MYVLYIKKFRQLRRITQEELSFLSGIHSSYISRLESDNIIRSRSPKLEVLLDLSIALKICPMDILTYNCNACEQLNSCKKVNKIDKHRDDFKERLMYYI